MLNLIAITVYKMTSHCTGTVQMRKRDKKVRRDVILDDSSTDGKRGGSSDMRWKTVPQTSGCNRKRSVAASDRRVGLRRASRDVDEAERTVVVWLQCLLVDVVRHTGTLAPDHVDICTPELRA